MVGRDDFHQLFELLVEFRVLSSRFLDLILKFCNRAARAGRGSGIVATKHDRVVAAAILTSPRQARGGDALAMWKLERDGFTLLARAVGSSFVGVCRITLLFMHDGIAQHYRQGVKVTVHDDIATV